MAVVTAHTQAIVCYCTIRPGLCRQKKHGTGCCERRWNKQRGPASRGGPGRCRRAPSSALRKVSKLRTLPRFVATKRRAAGGGGEGRARGAPRSASVHYSCVFAWGKATCGPLPGAKSHAGSTSLRSAPSSKCTDGMGGFYAKAKPPLPPGQVSPPAAVCVCPWVGRWRGWGWHGRCLPGWDSPKSRILFSNGQKGAPGAAERLVWARMGPRRSCRSLMTAAIRQFC